MSPFPVVVWLCLLVISAVWCATGIYDAALDEDDPNLPDNEEFERNIDATRPSPDKIYIPLAIPPRRWKKRENISKELVKFFEAKWSRAVFEPACSGKQWTIVPIYYWPGDTITLKCRVCTMGLAYNGLPKRWVVVRDIPKFFQKLDYAFAQGGAEFSFLQNKMEIYTGEQSYFDKKHPDNVPLSFSYNANGDYRKIIEHRTPPVFIQNGVDLIMYNLNSGNQGVYACIDEKSDSDVYFVYVLMAMLPPVNIPDELTTPANQQSW
ncbi:hypothetical protein WR25_10945 [Diploscapter pachys]|uniref:Ig-like domain-containing protein n=1 Tax=Diploscapter pachys TaxID=2018661 RepID=A0A2A2LY08_9BILA|nr:hypothetical protein WR25_10945 [Diploscapter pachys]